MKMAGFILPEMLGARPIWRTTPDAGECIAIDKKPSGSAIR